MLRDFDLEKYFFRFYGRQPWYYEEGHKDRDFHLVKKVKTQGIVQSGGDGKKWYFHGGKNNVIRHLAFGFKLPKERIIFTDDEPILNFNYCDELCETVSAYTFDMDNFGLNEKHFEAFHSLLGTAQAVKLLAGKNQKCSDSYKEVVTPRSGSGSDDVGGDDWKDSGESDCSPGKGWENVDT